MMIFYLTRRCYSESCHSLLGLSIFIKDITFDLTLKEPVASYMPLVKEPKHICSRRHSNIFVLEKKIMAFHANRLADDSKKYL